MSCEVIDYLNFSRAESEKKAESVGIRVTSNTPPYTATKTALCRYPKKAGFETGNPQTAYQETLLSAFTPCLCSVCIRCMTFAHDADQ